MMEAPKGLRRHIGLFGRRNAGKSSLLNALAGQDVSIVSDTPGTTTDPVEKTLEISPLGPVVLLDTAGVDDAGSLGRQRAERSMASLRRVDAALLVWAGQWGEPEDRLVTHFAERRIPFVAVRAKADTREAREAPRPPVLPDSVPYVAVSARHGAGLDALVEALARLLPDTEARPLLHDLVPPGGVALLVTPIDSGAPRGRLILPQVQAVRDCLDGACLCMVCTAREYAMALDRLAGPPDLVVCDSQVVHLVDAGTPAAIPMTTFSILMARFKGNLTQLAAGAAALAVLAPGDAVLIQEACSHHPQEDDIGRVKLPRLLARLAGGPLRVSMAAGKAPADYAARCRVVVHCGGCVITRGQMLARQADAAHAGCPMTNYGMAISLAQGVLPRVLAPFPDALDAYTAALPQGASRA